MIADYFAASAMIIERLPYSIDENVGKLAAGKAAMCVAGIKLGKLSPVDRARTHAYARAARA
jgi:hypothetical protein